MDCNGRVIRVEIEAVVGGDAYERRRRVNVKYGKVQGEGFEAMDSYVEGLN